jgi:hypothetical protein
MTATTDRPPAPPAVPRARGRAAHWQRSHHFDPRGAALADRHYSRRTPGSPQFMPPGRKCVLVTAAGDAVWGVSWPYPELVAHSYGDSWLCTIFRNEGPVLSSVLIAEAVAVTRYVLGEPPAGGLLTFVNARKVRHKRDPGRCFLRAGFVRVEDSKSGLVALRLAPSAMPEATPPLGEFDTRGRAARREGGG